MAAEGLQQPHDKRPSSHVSDGDKVPDALGLLLRHNGGQELDSANAR